ncbi:hypothetical protein WUBG_07736 [Wuchereria bancrofti]|uniref:Uncharacterized protein n=1 Tax=Wuchereria bancrofti TaxID=6293 RepID=J9EFV1_WUCBA|nr:hypothetical protein WUBG_07736 [Wuchereria bancrofti]
MSFRRIKCFRDFFNFSGSVCVRKFSTVRSSHGKRADINLSSTAISRAFMPLRCIPSSDLGHSVLANSDKDISLKIVQEGGTLSPKMVFAAKVSVSEFLI